MRSLVPGAFLLFILLPFSAFSAETKCEALFRQSGADADSVRILGRRILRATTGWDIGSGIKYPSTDESPTIVRHRIRTSLAEFAKLESEKASAVDDQWRSLTARLSDKGYRSPQEATYHFVVQALSVLAQPRPSDLANIKKLLLDPPGDLAADAFQSLVINRVQRELPNSSSIARKMETDCVTTCRKNPGPPKVKSLVEFRDYLDSIPGRAAEKSQALRRAAEIANEARAYGAGTNSVEKIFVLEIMTVQGVYLEFQLPVAYATSFNVNGEIHVNGASGSSNGSANDFRLNIQVQPVGTATQYPERALYAAGLHARLVELVKFATERP